MRFAKERLLAQLQKLVTLRRDKRQLKQRPELAVPQLALFVQLIRLADETAFIEPSPETQTVLLASLHLFADWFWRVFLRSPDSVLRQLPFIAAQSGIALHEVTLSLSPNLLHPNVVYLHAKRCEDEEALRLQILLRHAMARAEPGPADLDIIDDAELQVSAMDLDEACLIIQSVERLYQAISRFSHLVDVRQKALDVRDSDRHTNPLAAIVKVQAVTRGFLARKRIRALREEENEALGLNLSALLHSAARHQSTPLLHREMPQERFMVLTETPIPPPLTLADLDRFIRDNFFTTDPLGLEDVPDRGLRNVNETSEALLSELILAETANVREKTEPFDELTSQTVSARVRGKVSHVDLRTFLYATVVIPHALSSWSGFPVHRHSVLLVGESGTGKSAWAAALASKCLATCLRVSKKTFTKKFIGRKKLASFVTQFSANGENVFVEFDRLEIFGVRQTRKTPLKTLILKLLTSVGGKASQIIGMSRTADLIPEVLAAFDCVVSIAQLAALDRFNMLTDCLARLSREGRLQLSPSLPLTDVSKGLKKLNSGQILEKLTNKYAGCSNRRRND